MWEDIIAQIEILQSCEGSKRILVYMDYLIALQIAVQNTNWLVFRV